MTAIMRSEEREELKSNASNQQTRAIPKILRDWWEGNLARGRFPDKMTLEDFVEKTEDENLPIPLAKDFRETMEEGQLLELAERYYIG